MILNVLCFMMLILYQKMIRTIMVALQPQGICLWLLISSITGMLGECWQGQILGGGAHLPWDHFTPVLKFSAPPPRIFAPPLIHLAYLTASKRPGTRYQMEIHFAVVNHLYLLFSFVKLVET